MCRKYRFPGCASLTATAEQKLEPRYPRTTHTLRFQGTFLVSLAARQACSAFQQIPSQHGSREKGEVIARSWRKVEGPTWTASLPHGNAEQVRDSALEVVHAYAEVSIGLRTRLYRVP